MSISQYDYSSGCLSESHNSANLLKESGVKTAEWAGAGERRCQTGNGARLLNLILEHALGQQVLEAVV